MRYRAGFVNAFGELQDEKQFVSLFTDMASLVTYVGSNGTHLRRMAVIQERKLYDNPKYLGRCAKCVKNTNGECSSTKTA